MGLLVDGKWHDQWYDTEKTKGRFVRTESQYRNWVTPDGSPGPSGEGGFKAESGRYHLYVAYACPWAHRAVIFRELKKLNDHIDVSIVSPDMLENGWSFDKSHEGSTGDQLFGMEYLHQIYSKADPKYTGRVTVPVLWDKHKSTIVNNESSEIIRMFNSAFNDITGDSQDFYPEGLRSEIDEINSRVYTNINNGVYKCGFATTQEAYDENIDPLFNALDWVEDKLKSKGPYLIGDKITEADWRLFTTLVRFDPVYYSHFKCNIRRIQDYEYLSKYLKNLYNYSTISETVNFTQIKRHYYYSQKTVNPSQIVPKGPEYNIPR